MKRNDLYSKVQVKEFFFWLQFFLLRLKHVWTCALVDKGK